MSIGAVTLDTGVATAILSFGGLVFLSLIGWTLTNAVRLGQLVVRLEEKIDDLERRIGHLETR